MDCSNSDWRDSASEVAPSNCCLTSLFSSNKPKVTLSDISSFDLARAGLALAFAWDLLLHMREFFKLLSSINRFLFFLLFRIRQLRIRYSTMMQSIGNRFECPFFLFLFGFQSMLFRLISIGLNWVYLGYYISDLSDGTKYLASMMMRKGCCRLGWDRLGMQWWHQTELWRGSLSHGCKKFIFFHPESCP